MSIGREEFETSLCRDDVVQYYLNKSKEELEKEFGHVVARMVGYKQNNMHHCYNLWEHNLKTVEGIQKENLTMEHFIMLRVAGFFHDVGKPDVSRFNEKTGQQVFYGHAIKSVEVSRPLLEEMDYSEEEIKQIDFFIGHHDDFISYKSKLPPFMKNHEFVRGIDKATVAEKIIENKYDFEKMGYNKDQIRAILYTLVNNRKPNFVMQRIPVQIDFNLDEACEKITSGNYNTEYDADLADYQMLLALCKADAGAQAETFIQKGKDGKEFTVYAKAEKFENLRNIEQTLPEAYSYAMEIIENLKKRAHSIEEVKGVIADRTEYVVRDTQNARAREQQGPKGQAQGDE